MFIVVVKRHYVYNLRIKATVICNILFLWGFLHYSCCLKNKDYFSTLKNKALEIYLPFVIYHLYGSFYTRVAVLIVYYLCVYYICVFSLLQLSLEQGCFFNLESKALENKLLVVFSCICRFFYSSWLNKKISIQLRV